MTRTLAGLAAASMVFAACGGGDPDVSPEILSRALVENEGFTQEDADCVSNDLAAELSDEDFSTVALAETLDELTPELTDQVFATISACGLGG